MPHKRRRLTIECAEGPFGGMVVRHLQSFPKEPSKKRIFSVACRQARL